MAPLPRNAASRAQRGSRRNRDREIIDAAIELFSRQGYAATSMQDVADAVGLIKGSLYHYTSSKEELLFRIFNESHAQATEILDEVMALDLEPLERVRSYFERYVLWYLENVDHVGLFFTERRFLEGELRDIVRQRSDAYLAFVRQLIVDAQKAGEVGDHVDPKLAAFYIMGAVNSVPDWYERRGRISNARIAARFADMCVQVLTGAPPR